MVVAMISYDEHRAFLEKQCLLARAELAGFVQANIGPLVPSWTHDFAKSDEQARFEKGYQDGCAKLMQDRISFKTD
jgi:hypothetical protein